MLFMHCLPRWQPITPGVIGDTLARQRQANSAPQTFFELRSPGRTFGECVRRIHKQPLLNLSSENKFKLFSPCILTHARKQTLTHTHTLTHREWICHLIIMRRKILADGEHTEGCNYDPFQRAHAQWQCLHFHPERERKKLPRNDGKMCPSLQLRTIILCKKIVSIAFQPRSKMALMGVMVWNGGDSGTRSDISDGGTVG